MPREDSALVEEVRDRLAQVGCPLDEIEVTAERGVVTLKGRSMTWRPSGLPAWPPGRWRAW